MIVLYTASGVYHAIPGARYDPTVCLFRRVDLSAIFVLIAGSFTPIIGVSADWSSDGKSCSCSSGRWRRPALH